METTLVKAKDIAVEFAQGTKLKDIELLKDLLSKDGRFQIQNKDLDIIEVGKQGFIKWYKDKLDSTTITAIEYDQCIFAQQEIASYCLMAENSQEPLRMIRSAQKPALG